MVGGLGARGHAANTASICRLQNDGADGPETRLTVTLQNLLVKGRKAGKFLSTDDTAAGVFRRQMLMRRADSAATGIMRRVTP